MPFLQGNLGFFLFPNTHSTQNCEFILCVGVTFVDYWYVFAVQVGSEEKVRDLLIQKLDTSKEFHPFIPMKEKQIKRQGKRVKEKTICFPGHIFIMSNLIFEKFIAKTFPTIFSIKQIIKLLNYDGKTGSAMKEDEKHFLSKLLGNHFCIEESRGFFENGNTHIISGSLVGMENVIKCVNIHYRTVKIEFDFMGSKELLTVGFDFA